MKVLVLSPQAELLIPTITAHGDEALVPPDMVFPFTCKPEQWPEADYVVLFNYRFIVEDDVLEKYRGRIINIHTSVLPFNRGAHPNFWAWFNGTPNGVSIHRVDEGIDTGELLACMVMHDFRDPMTLQSTYDDLIIAAAGFFRDKWPQIRDNKTSDTITKYQRMMSSYHKEKDSYHFIKKLSKGWDSPVDEVARLGGIYRGGSWEVLK